MSNGRLSSSAAMAVALMLCGSAAWGADPVVADGEVSGVRAEITELKRSGGNTLTLRFTIVNEGDERLDVYPLLGHGDARDVHLIDAAGKKKYMPVTDGQRKCVCSAVSGPTRYIEAGKSVNLWARFPAPPADVAEVSVIVPRFIPVDVAIVD